MVTVALFCRLGGDGGGACRRWRGRGASQSAALVEEFLERLLRFLLPPVRSPSAGREEGRKGVREGVRKEAIEAELNSSVCCE